MDTLDGIFQLLHFFVWVGVVGLTGSVFWHNTYGPKWLRALLVLCFPVLMALEGADRIISNWSWPLFFATSISTGFAIALRSQYQELKKLRPPPPQKLLSSGEKDDE